MDFVYTKDLKIDVYIPNKTNFKTVVYFHGGGIVEGSRSDSNLVKMSNFLKDKGICVFNCDYSLYPNTKFPEFLLDAAKAVKKAFEMNKSIKGNGEIYVAGSSAGAYISLMLCFNKEYLLSEGINPIEVKGWFIESGQPTDHFHVIQFEEGLSPDIEKVSKFAPIYYLNKDFISNPIKLIAYSNDLNRRLEQNKQFFEKIKTMSPNQNINFEVFNGGHCDYSSNKPEEFAQKIIDFISKN